MAKKAKGTVIENTWEPVDNCPHCGGKAEVRAFNTTHLHGWVGCPECGCYINWNHDPAGAIAKWNKRVTLHVA
jgi:transcription elongation factor Elf1